MNRLLLSIIFLLSHLFVNGQSAYLFVMKGAKKKKTYEEGDRIYLRMKDETLRYGLITHLLNDTIYIVGQPVPRADIKDVIVSVKEKKKFEMNAAALLLVTGGVGLVTAGLTLSKQATFKKALIAGLTIGYGPIALRYLASKVNFRRRKFHIGSKYRLKLIDFYVPRKRAF